MAPTRRQDAWAGAALALDLDGTLIDARVRQVAVAREALGWATGETLDESRFWRLKRSGANTLTALERLGVTPDGAARAAQRWGEQIEADRWLDLDRTLPGVASLLGELQAASASITVITARRRADGATRSLRAACLVDLVDELIVVDPDDAVAAKAQALRDRAATAFVGDSDGDGRAAAAAGVAFRAVATGQRNAGYLGARGHLVARSLRAALGSLSASRTPARI